MYSNNLHLQFHKRIAASFCCIIIAISIRIGKLASFIRLLDHIVSRVLAEYKFTEPCVGRRDLDAAKMRVFLSLKIEKALPRQPGRLGIFSQGQETFTVGFNDSFTRFRNEYLNIKRHVLF